MCNVLRYCFQECGLCWINSMEIKEKVLKQPVNNLTSLGDTIRWYKLKLARKGWERVKKRLELYAAPWKWKPSPGIGNTCVFFFFWNCWYQYIWPILLPVSKRIIEMNSSCKAQDCCMCCICACVWSHLLLWETCKGLRRPFSSLGIVIRSVHCESRDHGCSNFSIIQGTGRLV